MTGGPEALDVVVARVARVGRVTPGRGDAGGVAPPVTVWTCAEPAVDVPGWVPDPPTGPDARAPGPGGGSPPTPTDDLSDDATAARRALSAAMASYSAVHGHPLGADETPGPRRFRVAVGARVAAAAVVALLVVVGVVAVRAWHRSQSVAVPLPSVTTAAGGGDGGAAPVQAGAPEADGGSVPAVVVHVVGEVANPGVVALEPGARVADTFAAAGGATASADIAAVNLARVLTDGEQVVVPAPGQVPVAAALGGGSGTGVGAGPVDLNRADAAALDTLPGIGPVLAERIVSWRDEHGRFTAVEELAEVSGIGPALLAGVRDLVQVG